MKNEDKPKQDDNCEAANAEPHRSTVASVAVWDRPIATTVVNVLVHGVDQGVVLVWSGG